MVTVLYDLECLHLMLKHNTACRLGYDSNAFLLKLIAEKDGGNCSAFG